MEKQKEDITVAYNIFSNGRIVSSFEVSGKDEDECQEKAEQEYDDFVSSLSLEEE
ncbi:MAG: hypothetical protein WCY85_08870 [Sulfurimonas sp.]|jgi:hypothetical protein